MRWDVAFQNIWIYLDFFVPLLKTISKFFLLTAYRITSQQTKVFTFLHCFSLKYTLSSPETRDSDCSKGKDYNLWSTGALERVALLFKIWEGLKCQTNQSIETDYYLMIVPFSLFHGTVGYLIIYILRKIRNIFS